MTYIPQKDAIPSGKRLHNYGKIHHAMKMCQSTISMAMFKFAKCNSHYQAGYLDHSIFRHTTSWWFCGCVRAKPCHGPVPMDFTRCPFNCDGEISLETAQEMVKQHHLGGPTPGTKPAGGTRAGGARARLHDVEKANESAE